jgi:hypothetical protein
LEVKDLYDLYFILQNEKVTLNDLFTWVEKKFWVELNHKDIIARLLYLSQNIENIQAFLLEEIDFTEIKSFFENLI